MKNVTLTSAFDSFSNLQKKIASTDFSFSNEILGKINDYLSANIQFSLVYDDNVTKALQVKQVIALGVNVTIL
jgi:hypothetical protein